MIDFTTIFNIFHLNNILPSSLTSRYYQYLLIQYFLLIILQMSAIVLAGNLNELSRSMSYLYAQNPKSEGSQNIISQPKNFLLDGSLWEFQELKEELTLHKRLFVEQFSLLLLFKTFIIKSRLSLLECSWSSSHTRYNQSHFYHSSTYYLICSSLS